MLNCFFIDYIQDDYKTEWGTLLLEKFPIHRLRTVVLNKCQATVIVTGSPRSGCKEPGFIESGSGLMRPCGDIATHPWLFKLTLSYIS